MNFSILVPTRNRPQLVSDLIESIVQNTEDKSNTEIIVKYDNDDLSTLGIVDNLQLRFSNKIKLELIRAGRSFNLNHDYYNWMATQRATGKYLIAVNDDTRFVNFAWDTMALRKIEAYLLEKTDRIFYGVTSDMEIERKRTEHFWFTCFPLVSIEAVRALGFIFDPMIYKDGADWDVYGIYQGIGRILDLRQEIVIQHLSVRSGRREKDALDYDNHLIYAHGHIPPVSAGTNTHLYVQFLIKLMGAYAKPNYNGESCYQLMQENRLNDFLAG